MGCKGTTLRTMRTSQPDIRVVQEAQVLVRRETGYALTDVSHAR